MSPHPPRAALRLLSLLALAALLLAPAAARPAHADEAAPLVADNVEEWSAGAGLLYWASTCFADEFNPFAVLKRKPAGGGAERTLESINDGARCITFQSMVSAADGLYYVDMSEGRIERMPLSEPYTPQVVRPLPPAELPNRRPGLVEAGEHLYWISGSAIRRARKDGTGAVETVAATGAEPGDLAVVGATVYWADSAGIWAIDLGCAALPCDASKRQLSNVGQGARVGGLIYQFIGGAQGSYRLYWVERTGSGGSFSAVIRVRGCNQISVCFLLPPPGQLPPPPALLYAATPGWQIGDLALAGGNLYWTEADRTTVSNNNGDVKRRATSAGGTGAETIATGQANIDDRIAVAGDRLLFARQNTGVYSLPLNASAILRDFSVAGMEVTQGIQNLANQAPLVAAKTTYVRGYARQLSGPSAPNVEARLVGLRGGAPLPGSPLQPINGVRALVTGAGFNRARLNDGWYFLLPASWTAAGPITLRLEVDARQIHSDPNRADNQIAQAVTFQEADPVCVMTVPVRTHTPLPSVYDPNVFAMVDQFERRWPTPDVWVFRDAEPVEELQICTYYGIPYPCYGPYELTDGWGLTNGIPDRDKVMASLWTRAQLSFNPDVCDDIGAPVHYMGLVHPDADTGGVLGYASPFSKQSWVQLPPHLPNPMPARWDAMNEGGVMAQELAHNYGRKHVDCENPDDIDTNYPYPPCQIANTGAESYYGFDVRALLPIEPNRAADFMSYADDSWVSDYTWRALLGELRASGLAAAEPQPQAAPAQASRVYVSGLVDAAGARGEITTLLALPADTLPPATLRTLAAQQADLAANPAAASFRLRLRGPGGAVLLERPLALTPLDDHTDDGDPALFSDLFAPPAGTVAAIELLADGAVIDTLRPGAAAPAVAIQQPSAGATISESLTLGWTASDPDRADRLLLTVQYSHDAGASWRTLALDMPAGPEPRGSLTLDDLGSLPGSAPGAARIRILASDGYNTAIATSAPFTVSDRAPEPAIVAPAPGQSFAAGEPVTLHGAALDPERGGLSGAALSWKVDGVSQGVGADLVLAGLAPGAHTAELTAADAGGRRATATVSFRVEPLSVPQGAAPALDGACDDAGYAAASAVGLKPYASGAQATARLLRSADHLWLCLSGLQPGAEGQSAFVGLRVDVDNSRGAQAQPTDVGFFVGEDGSVFTRAGDGAGGFGGAGPGGLQAQVAAGAGAWSAELRVERAALGGWDRVVGLSVGHYGLSAGADGLAWPYAARVARPDTWAAAALGSQATLTGLAPLSATAGGPALTLTIEGGGFAEGSVALWDGQPLPTSFVSAERLTAQVGAERLAAAGTAQVSVRAPGAAGLASNALPFVVQAPAPVVAGVAPGRLFAGSGGLSLTVTGQHFDAGAQVLWNGQPLPTRQVSPTSLVAQVDAALLLRGQTVGIAVRGQAAGGRVSGTLPLVVEGRPFQLSLPLLRR